MQGGECNAPVYGGAQWTRLTEIGEELPRLYTKCTCELYDVLQGDIPLTALHTAHVVPVQIGFLCELFLRIATFFPQLSHGRAEARFYRTCGHISMLES